MEDEDIHSNVQIHPFVACLHTTHTYYTYIQHIQHIQHIHTYNTYILLPNIHRTYIRNQLHTCIHVTYIGYIHRTYILAYIIIHTYTHSHRCTYIRTYTQDTYVGHTHLHWTYMHWIQYTHTQQAQQMGGSCVHAYVRTCVHTSTCPYVHAYAHARRG